MLTSIQSNMKHLNKLVLSAIILLTTTWSCNNVADKDQNEYIVTATEDVEGKLSDLIKINRVVPLETNDHSVMQAISSVKKRNGRYYIISKNRPYIFDDNGRFLFMPSRIGQGPGEYAQQVNSMDADDEHIYLYAPPKLITLTLDGEFVKEASTDWGWGGEFRKIPQGFLTVTENMPDSTHIGFYDNNLTPIIKDAKFSGYMDLAYRGVWAKWKDGKYIQNGGKSTDFYIFDADVPSFSKIKFSDQNDGLTVEEHYEQAWKQMKSDADIPNFLVDSPTSFGNNCIFFCKESDNTWPMYYLHATSDKAKVLKPTVDDLTYLKSAEMFLSLSALASSDENNVLTILNIDDIDFNSDAFINRKGIYTKLDSISSDSNPIIIEFEIIN